jgi:RNA polymerase sigma factor for flagellar operon FliA
LSGPGLFYSLCCRYSFDILNCGWRTTNDFAFNYIRMTIQHKAYARLQGNDRERVIAAFIPIIKHLAYKMSGAIDDYALVEDLVSAGTIGLLEAMEKFDPQRGIKLNTYAYLRIRGAIVDELRNRDWFPRSVRAKAKRVEETVRKLENRLGGLPTEEDIAREMGIDIDEYLDVIKKFSNLSVMSIDELSENSGMGHEQLVGYAVDEENSPEDYAQLHDLERIMGQQIDKLPERQRLVLSLYYHEDMNMKEIAGVLGVTEARVCQIHSQAIINLRAAMKKLSCN